jgi:hypothetical protein
MEKQDGRSRMAPIVTSWRNPRNADEFGFRHGQVENERGMVYRL